MIDSSPHGSFSNEITVLTIHKRILQHRWMSECQLFTQLLYSSRLPQGLVDDKNSYRSYLIDTSNAPASIVDKIHISNIIYILNRARG